MAKAANFFISGVWKNSTGNITHVHLHKVNENNSFDIGKKVSESEVIKLLKLKNTIMTIIWQYPNWTLGASVEVVQSQFGEYLRTNRDKTAKDNLDNLIKMESFNVLN